jgi:hypothetical protein
LTFFIRFCCFFFFVRLWLLLFGVFFFVGCVARVAAITYLFFLCSVFVFLWWGGGVLLIGWAAPFIFPPASNDPGERRSIESWFGAKQALSAAG